ncbi:hypothetical protein A1A1_16710 [Planococcus antarcticus DSM 14505]|uniref:Uncharacterized protein n=1 Tax=Planococcus antarcticus DSM 14505 TaxID=1185653 RepID=A0AA87LRF9_9BACL|nr:hypothetical protein [Planococcus antarcticus]EIM05324.1 hypothetical protein A1A1_16710 [Planococcus antarcticus DSM 14505]
MNGFKVVIEHDFFSRKPINITFKCSLVEKESGNVLHSTTFRHWSFDFGLYKAEKYKEKFSRPETIVALIAVDISHHGNFELDMSQGFDKFMENLFQNSSTEYLREYLARTSHAVDRTEIEKELTLRGEINNEKTICVGSN